MTSSRLANHPHRHFSALALRWWLVSRLHYFDSADWASGRACSLWKILMPTIPVGNPDSAVVSDHGNWSVSTAHTCFACMECWCSWLLQQQQTARSDQSEEAYSTARPITNSEAQHIYIFKWHVATNERKHTLQRDQSQTVKRSIFTYATWWQTEAF